LIENIVRALLNNGNANGSRWRRKSRTLPVTAHTGAEILKILGDAMPNKYRQKDRGFAL
jgi:hypothetical protein